MIIPAPNDIAFNIGAISIYYYGIIMAGAIFVALIAANFLFNKTYPQYKKDIVLESAPIIIILGILGARLYFCCLNPHYYFTRPLEILDIREGGLSIHGGIIGGILSILWIMKKYKIGFFKLIDPVACATALGQAIGRWGNYFNSEAYGLPTASQKWGLYIPIKDRVSQYSNYSFFHPTFLYESILDLIAFFVLLYIFKKFGKKYAGLTFFAYLTIYGVIRFFIENLRIDSELNIGGVIPIAGLVSVFFIIIGITGIFYTLKHNKTVR
ncbi:MAG: prolipoprotein diacylglyceryl transferase [Cyanobacteriota bacterium]|nr:prolipoprotein diacylglyceryl transferase [Cyanobacteriota bacterium]